MRVGSAIGLSLFLARLAAAQLYLLTGTATPYYGGAFSSRLLKVNDGGLVETVLELASRDDGIQWFAASTDLGAAVLLVKNPTGPVVVLDFATLETKTCKLPLAVVEAWRPQRLADSPANGRLFQWDIGRDQQNVPGMIVDLSVPCARSFVQESREDVTRPLPQGSAGVASTEFTTLAAFWVDPSGKVIEGGDGAGHRELLDCDGLPMALMKGSEYYAVAANNREILVVQGHERLRGPRGRLQRTLVFRKSDRTWHSVPENSHAFPPLVRAFGKYVAIVESNAASNASVMDCMIGGGGAPKRCHDSLGRYPGRLHLYDSDTERTFTIETEQPDSEIVLVENGVVYYRSVDKLYSAPITDKGIGDPTLIAAVDAIRDVHWAFFKH